MTLTELGDAIRSAPMAWKQIPADQQELAKAALLPKNGFDTEQKRLLTRWWLLCTQKDIDAINALLPTNTRVAGLDYQGALYLCGDLLTDAVSEGGTYRAALPVLEGLVCYYIDPPPQPPASKL